MPFFKTNCPFLKKVSFLAYIECCCKFLEYALHILITSVSSFPFNDAHFTVSLVPSLDSVFSSETFLI